MADCKVCGAKLNILRECPKCRSNRFAAKQQALESERLERIAAYELEEKLKLDAKIEKEKKRAYAIAEASEREIAINSVLLTTETAPNLPITDRIEIVTAECAFGMNVFKDLFAGVRDIIGGRSEAVQKTLRDTRRTALYELKKEAYDVGANAVVGVDLDYTELSASGNMVLLVASGTAVKILN